MTSLANASSTHTTKALQYMVRQVGKPYVWGGVGPNGYDCSGLGYAAFKHAGITLGRFTTYTMMRLGKAVARANVQPGDAILPNPGHVYWYIGNGKVVEAAKRGIPVRVREWKASEKVFAIRRLAPPGAIININAEVIGTSFDNVGFEMPHNDLLKLTEPLAAFAQQLTDPVTWIRVGMVLGGATLVMVAITLTNAGTIMKQVGKVLK